MCRLTIRNLLVGILLIAVGLGIVNTGLQVPKEVGQLRTAIIVFGAVLMTAGGSAGFIDPLLTEKFATVGGLTLWLLAVPVALVLGFLLLRFFILR